LEFHGFGPKIGGLLYRVFIGLGFVFFSDQDDIPIPVDIHDTRIAFLTKVIWSEVDPLSLTLQNYSPFVKFAQETWRLACQKASLDWLEIDRALWILGSKGCATERHHDCCFKRYCIKGSEMKRGLLVAFEGLDNAGKSTLIERLSRKFNAEQTPSVMTRELTTPVGRLAIKYVKKNAPPKMKALLFAADRLERQLNNVEPALSSGKIVFADRWFFSALAYRLAESETAKHKDMERYVRSVNKYNLNPNITFFIDITPAESIKRGTPINKNNYTASFLRKVRACYLQLFSNSKAVVLDGKLSLDELEREAYATIKSMLRNHK